MMAAALTKKTIPSVLQICRSKNRTNQVFHAAKSSLRISQSRKKRTLTIKFYCKCDQVVAVQKPVSKYSLSSFAVAKSKCIHVVRFSKEGIKIS